MLLSRSRIGHEEQLVEQAGHQPTPTISPRACRSGPYPLPLFAHPRSCGQRYDPAAALAAAHAAGDAHGKLLRLLAPPFARKRYARLDHLARSIRHRLRVRACFRHPAPAWPLVAARVGARPPCVKLSSGGARGTRFRRSNFLVGRGLRLWSLRGELLDELYDFGHDGSSTRMRSAARSSSGQTAASSDPPRGMAPGAAAPVAAAAAVGRAGGGWRARVSLRSSSMRTIVFSGRRNVTRSRRLSL